MTMVVGVVGILVGFVLGVLIVATGASAGMFAETWLKAEVWGQIIGGFLAAVVGLSGAVMLDVLRSRKEERARLRHCYGEILTLQIMAAPMIGFFSSFEQFLDSEQRRKDGRVLIPDPRKSPPDLNGIRARLGLLSEFDEEAARTLSYAANAVEMCLQEDAADWWDKGIHAGHGFAESSLSAIRLVQFRLAHRLGLPKPGSE